MVIDPGSGTRLGPIIALPFSSWEGQLFDFCVSIFLCEKIGVHEPVV